MKPIVMDGPRMSDISEPAESLWLREYVEACLHAGRRLLGMHLWSHSPRRLIENPILLPLLGRLRDSGVPITLQITITGLGGTAAEPGIEDTGAAFNAIRVLLERGRLTPDRICLRIDPLQAWHGSAGTLSNLEKIPVLLEQARALDIRRVRVSLTAYSRYRKRILPREVQRGLREAPLPLPRVGDLLREGLRTGMEIRTCATDLASEGVPVGSCFDFSWVTGLPLLEPMKPVAPRAGCLCLVPEGVSVCKIPRRSACSGRCLACYAQDHD